MSRPYREPMILRWKLTAAGCAVINLILGWFAVVFALLSGLCIGSCTQHNRVLPWCAVLAATAGLITGIALLLGPSDAPRDRVRVIGLSCCTATGLAAALIVVSALISA